jgi:hypothetical protein
MTADDARLFGQLVALLDSDQHGERSSALEKIFSLRTKHNFPNFGDVLHTLNSTVPLADYQKLESDLAQCLRQNQLLRAAVNFGRGLRRAAVVAVVIGIGCGGYYFLWPDASAADALARAMLAEMNGWQNWPSKTFMGDSKPIVHAIEGRSWWVIIRGAMDKTSHADPSGNPDARHCQHYFAAPAQFDPAPPAAYLAPQPYGWFGRMTWPEVAMQCQKLSP